MIEQKLLERGISSEELLWFARLPKHNAKEDVLNRILWSRTSLGDIKGKVSKTLAEILSEIGLTFEKYSPEKNQEYLKKIGEGKYNLYVARMMAVEMLVNLQSSRYGQNDETIGFDRIYNDTFNIKEDIE